MSKCSNLHPLKDGMKKTGVVKNTLGTYWSCVKSMVERENLVVGERQSLKEMLIKFN